MTLQITKLNFNVEESFEIANTVDGSYSINAGQYEAIPVPNKPGFYDLYLLGNPKSRYICKVRITA